jgi:hypothetical protein
MGNARATNRASSRRHQINDATPHKWATIIDTHDDRATASSVCYAHHCSEWKCLVRGGHSAGARNLATSGLATRVDRGDARLCVSGGPCNNADDGSERSDSVLTYPFFHEMIPLLLFVEKSRLEGQPERFADDIEAIMRSFDVSGEMLSALRTLHFYRKIELRRKRSEMLRSTIEHRDWRTLRRPESPDTTGIVLLLV